MPKSDYDWKAFTKGNFIQKYWKHKIFYLVSEAIIGAESKKILNPIVDIGCGSSPLLKMLHAEDKTGVDIDISKIDFIEDADKTSKYICRPGEDTGLESEYYSAVLCIEVLEHHSEPEKLIEEVARLCKPEGTVVLATPDFGSMRWQWIERVYGILMSRGYHDEHEMQFTESTLINMARQYNLKHIWTKKVWGADMVCKFRKVPNA